MRYVYRISIRRLYSWSLILGLLWINGYVLAGAPPENQQPNQPLRQKTSISEYYFQKFRPEVLKAYKAHIKKKDNESIPTSADLDIPKLVQREREHADDYYVFYHGQRSEHRILQDFWLKTMEMMQLTTTKDFIPIRFPDPKDFKPISPTNFIQEMKSRELNDHDSDIAKHLLSSNIALFGNHEEFGESSLHYYLNGCNWSDCNIRKFLEQSFEYYDFDPKFIEDLSDDRVFLKKDPGNLWNSGNSGNLLQIFIPKKIVEQCAYISHALGCPFTYNLGLEGYDASLGYQKQIGPFLQGCEADKVTGYNLKYAQARILITQDIMLNPQSGVKIFRETALPKDETDHYIQQMDHITTQIMIDWLNRYLNSGNDPNQQIKPEALERIKDTPFGQLVADKQRARALLQKFNETNSVAKLLPLEGDKELLHA